MNRLITSFLTCTFVLLISHQFALSQTYEEIKVSDNLYIQQMTPSCYRHISFIEVENYGDFPSNGLIYVTDDGAVIFDTPVYPVAAKDLIQWLTQELKVKIAGVVINHFHEDCLGTLASFHELGVPSYANSKTTELAAAENFEIPKYTFTQDTTLNIGGREIICHFPGEAHSPDNIVAYIPEDEVLFGGCMVKSKGASKGYLGVANIDEWSNTVRRVKSRFSKAKMVVPGHGDHGGLELIDYTAELFTQATSQD